MIINRDIASRILTAAKKNPLIGIVGPRQSGKTKLAQMLFPNYNYVSLEDLDNRLFAHEDPRGFLETYHHRVIFDEIQKVPELFSYLQTAVDADSALGRFILTGSQHFLLHKHISQTLAGRIALFTLLPLSMAELASAHIQFPTYEEYLIMGMYPRIYDRKLRPDDWYPNYIQTYIERDIRDLQQIGDLSTFQIFVKLCAGRIGQILNLSSLARDCGITHNTARVWLSLLETSFIVYLLRPYYENFGKRLVKMPKIYFYDTGLACSLLGIQTKEQIATHYLKGSLFESFILSEYVKEKMNTGKLTEYYFWRDKNGHEVDIIEEKGNTLQSIEIKAGKTLVADDGAGLTYFTSLSKSAKKRILPGKIVYGGSINQSRHPWNAISWKNQP